MLFKQLFYMTICETIKIYKGMQILTQNAKQQRERENKNIIQI